MGRVRVGTITIKSASPGKLAEFWRQLLGYVEVPHPTSSTRLDDPDGIGPTLLIQPGEPQRAGSCGVLHLDLRPDDHVVAVAHAIALGATRLQIGQTGQESWEVLADPDGNPFCILRGETDRQATT